MIRWIVVGGLAWIIDYLIADLKIWITDYWATDLDWITATRLLD